MDLEFVEIIPIEPICHCPDCTYKADKWNNFWGKKTYRNLPIETTDGHRSESSIWAEVISKGYF
jgi:hypothetical protein